MSASSPETYQSLLLALQEKQVELEKKNEELRRVQESFDHFRKQAEAARRSRDERFVMDDTQQQSAIASWGESEERFRAIFEQAAVGVAQLSPEGHWLAVNQKLCEIVGYSRDEILTKTFQEITYPDDLETDLNYVQQLLAGQIQTYSMEKRYRRKDGTLVWGKLTVSLVRELTGAPKYFISVVEDVSARKHAEEVSACQATVLELIAQGVPAARTLTILIERIEKLCLGMLCTVLRLDDDGKHLRHFAAAGMPAHYNHAVDGLAIGPRVGSCGTALFRREQVIVEDIATDPLWEKYRDLALPLGLRACWSTPIFDDDGQVLGTFANYYPQPGRPTAEHLKFISMATHLAAIALGKQRKEFSLRMSELALKAVSQGVMVTGVDERIIWANPAFDVITGYQLPEYLGRKCTFVQGPLTDQMTLNSIREAIKNGTEFTGEILNYRKDKTLYWNELTISPVRDDQGQLTHFIGVVRDISSRKLAEAALIQSEKRYRQLFECNPHPMWVFDLETLAFLAVNAAAVKQYGYSEQEFLEMTILDIRPPAEQSLLLESLKIPKPDLAHAAYWRHQRKNGELIDVEITSHKLDFSGRPAEIVLAYDITLSRQAEAALQQSEARFRTIIEQAPLGIAEGDFAGNHFINVNQRYADIVGYSIGELKNMTFKDFTHPDDLAMDLVQMEKLAAGEIPLFALEKRYVRKDGAIIWVKITVAGLGPAGAKPTRCMAVIDDITEQKATVTALELSERRYKTIIEAEPECVKVVSADGELLEMNPAGLSMLEASSVDEVRQHGMMQFILPKYQLAFAKLHEGAIAGWGGLLEFEVIGLRGAQLWLETHAVPLPDADGRVTKMLGITRDITQRKLSAQALKEKEQRLSFLLEQTPAVIYTCRASGDYGATFITDNVQSQLGYQPREFLEDAAFWVNSIHPDDQARILNDLAQLAEKGGQSHDYRFRHADGTYRWMHDEVRVMRNAEGHPTEIIGSWIDISSLKQAEEDVRQLNAGLEARVLERTAQLEAANKELEAFSYSVSHDLRAPLRGMDGFARMIEEDCSDQLDREGMRMIGVVRSEAKRMGQLIDDLLGFSRMGRKIFEHSSIDLRDLARDVFESVISTLPDTSVRFELGELPSIQGDRSLLRQVLFNLIDNAVKFSRNQPAPVIEVGCTDEAGVTAFFVRDNGVGFDAQYSHKLFGVFQRLHGDAEFEGTGIGLALVQRIIHRHGGKVWATSVRGSGATFYFTIPNGVKSNE